MINSVKKYMIVDLLLLASIGFIIDIFGIKFECILLGGVPTSVVSFLIIFIAITRWNLWGLTIIPVLSLGVLIGGANSGSAYLAYAYDIQLYMANSLALLIFGLNYIFFRNGKTKKIVESSVKLVLIIILDYLLYSIIMIVLYRILTSGNIFESGIKLISYVNLENEYVTVNICRYVENVLINNLLGLAVMIIGTFVLRSQGIVCNRKQKFIDDKENAELIIKDRNFRINDANEIVKNDDLSQENTEK